MEGRDEFERDEIAFVFDSFLLMTVLAQSLSLSLLGKHLKRHSKISIGG